MQQQHKLKKNYKFAVAKYISWRCLAIHLMQCTKKIPQKHAKLFITMKWCLVRICVFCSSGKKQTQEQYTPANDWMRVTNALHSGIWRNLNIRKLYWYVNNINNNKNAYIQFNSFQKVYRICFIFECKCICVRNKNAKWTLEKMSFFIQEISVCQEFCAVFLLQ